MEENDDIFLELKELKNTAPYFSTIKKYNCFEVPLSYFENLTTRISNSCLELDELPENAILLLNKAKANAFVVPDNYFDELPYAIKENIDAEIKQIFSVKKLINFIKPQFTIPSFVAVMLIFIGFMVYKNEIKNKEYALKTKQLSRNVSNITPDYLNNIDEIILIEELDIKKLIDDDAENRMIENYLIDNHTDCSQIINQLESF